MSTDSITTRAKEIFCSALDVACEARSTLVDAHCGDDAALRARVERLLAAHERSERVFGDPHCPWGPRGAGLFLPVRDGRQRGELDSG